MISRANSVPSRLCQVPGEGQDSADLDHLVRRFRPVAGTEEDQTYYQHVDYAFYQFHFLLLSIPFLFDRF
jgi:hypothetical protein